MPDVLDMARGGADSPPTAGADILDLTRAAAVGSGGGRLNTPEALGIPRDPGSLSDTIMHGGTFGFSDEIGAAMSAGLMYGVDSLTGKRPDGATLHDYYDANLSNIRGGLENYKADHPIASTVGEAMGGLMDFNPEAAISSVAKGFWPVVKDGAVTGGAMGAASGFGDASGGTENRLKGALIGGTAGAVTGGAAPALVPWTVGAVRSVSRMFRNAVAPWSKDAGEFINNTASNVLQKVAGPNGAQFDEPPLPDMKLTTGQATNNPGLKWVERSIEQGSPDGPAMAEEARTANNQAITRSIGQLGDVSANPNEAMLAAVEKANDAAKATTRAAWKSAGVDETTGISAPQFQEHVGDYVKGLSIAGRKNIPPDVMDTLGQISESGTTNLGEIQDIRSNVTDALRAAASSGQSNRARILGGLADTISDFIDNVPMPKEAAEAYETARAATKQMKQTFTQPAAVRNVLGVDRYGADKTPLSAVADTFIRSGKGAPEAFQSYLNAVGDDPAGLQAARDAFAQRFLDNVQTTVKDAKGTPLVNAAEVSKFLDGHDHIVNSSLFDDNQRDLIQRIGQAADMSQRTAQAGARGGSDTYAKFAGPKFLDELIGPHASKLLPVGAAIAGAGAGVHVGGPLGAIAGAGSAVGAAIAGESKLDKLLYGATRDQVMAVIHQAMSQPALAKALMMNASRKSELQMSPVARRMIYSVLGAQTTNAIAQGALPQGQR